MEPFLKNRVAFNCKKRFFLALALLILQRACNLFVAAADTLSVDSSLRGNQTIISNNGTFELGFFNPNGTNNWYVGIWYAQIPDNTIIWVANRETPIKNQPGLLSLSKSGYLTVSDLKGNIIWSSNDTQKTRASMATILDSGNFVLLDPQNTSETVWESFAQPTDHFMPTSKLWKGMKLYSWKSSLDPAPGPFFLQMNPSPGKTDFVLQYETGVSYYTQGEWTGRYFSTMPGQYLILHFSRHSWRFLRQICTMHMILNPKFGRRLWRRNLLAGTASCGSPCRLITMPGAWFIIHPLQIVTCMVCAGLMELCSCVEGFEPRNATIWTSQEWWSSGCVRRSPLNCSTDGFLQVTNISFPEDRAAFQNAQESLSPQGCKTACLNNCSCTAFAFTDSNSAVCKLWFGDLLGMQTKATSSDDQSSFLRLAASDVPQLSSDGGSSSSSRSRVISLSVSIPLGLAVLGALLVGAWFIQRRRRRLLEKAEYNVWLLLMCHSSSSRSRVIALSVSIPLGLALLGALLIVAWFIQRRRRRLLEKGNYKGPTTSLRAFTYREMKTATHKFANKLGKEAFGSVYKGEGKDKQKTQK